MSYLTIWPHKSYTDESSELIRVSIRDHASKYTDEKLLERGRRLITHKTFDWLNIFTSHNTLCNPRNFCWPNILLNSFFETVNSDEKSSNLKTYWKWKIYLQSHKNVKSESHKGIIIFSSISERRLRFINDKYVRHPLASQEEMWRVFSVVILHRESFVFMGTPFLACA